MDAQCTRTEESGAKPCHESVAIPWKEWMRSVRASHLDEQRADVAAATLVLRSLHDNGKVADQAVDIAVGLDSRHMTAKASEDVEVDVVESPPFCVRSSVWEVPRDEHAPESSRNQGHTHKEHVAKRMTGQHRTRVRARADRKVGHVLRAP